MMPDPQSIRIGEEIESAGPLLQILVGGRRGHYARGHPRGSSKSAMSVHAGE
ncbi:hypothetical protein [Rhodococcus sp. RDE2]|uniref:hypothetical protein n=1 Tax=Rhodococcus sp. RDE2 TaxID=2885078 RepID=UPI001E3DBA59|nr:hypothetical protein [Rhodococcus sp. RDE2]